MQAACQIDFVRIDDGAVILSSCDTLKVRV